MSILAERISKRYRGAARDALHNVSLACDRGVFGLLGPNGAGKTTLMRILATLITPSSGCVTVRGINLVDEPERARPLLGYVPQEYTLYPHLTAWEFLEYMAGLSGMRNPRRRIEQVLDQAGLVSMRRHRLNTFSGGMKQRVVIAQALLHDPPVLLVDEPTAGLDPAERVRFRNLLSDLGREKTVLLSTHIVDDITATCRQIAILSDGLIAFSGEIDALVSAAREKVWQAQISSIEWERARAGYITVSSRPASQTGWIEVKFLTKDFPPPFEATPVTPTIEDAYLLLITARQRYETASPGIGDHCIQ
ncbi:MAG TPA: ABC transporter ATP-binding protein [Anaerolineaceae bacterium]|nr:ABC transporter ATP-binding protein [Anaerolineaceae bacterium]